MIAAAAVAAGLAYYSYRHVTTGCAAARVGLEDVSVRSGHVAAWLGVDDGNDWIQAGVEQIAGEPSAHVYVEVGHHMRAVPQSNVWYLRTIRYGQTVLVRLVRHRYWWSVLVGGSVEASVPLRRPTVRILAGESYDSYGRDRYRPLLACVERA